MKHLARNSRLVFLGMAGYWACTALMQDTLELAWMRIYATTLLSAIVFCTWPTSEDKE